MRRATGTCSGCCARPLPRAAASLSNEALRAASRRDGEQTLCFMRWIDGDRDGLISEADFCNAVVNYDAESLAQLATLY